MLDKRKVVIIGAGHVGSHVAMALCFQELAMRLLLLISTVKRQLQTATMLQTHVFFRLNN